eukprot:8975844-Pyramimonas_sp.AAC.1
MHITAKAFSTASPNARARSDVRSRTPTRRRPISDLSAPCSLPRKSGGFRGVPSSSAQLPPFLRADWGPPLPDRIRVEELR